MTNWKNLVIEGGGSKNIATLGALDYLYNEKKDDMLNIKNYAGSSAGSMIVTLLIIGYTPKEIVSIITSKDLNKSMKSNRFMYPINFLWKFGFNTREPFVNVFSKLLENKNFDSKITFLQLYMQTEKTLVITGTNITKRKIVYFNHQSHPNVTIIDAIQASINIPYYFTKYELDGDYYIDGGVLDNFPLYYFDKYNENENGILCKDSRHLKIEFPEVKGDCSECNKTLGILTIDVEYNEKNEYIDKGNSGVSSLYDYTMSTIHALLHNTEVQKMRSDYWERIIAIKLPYYIESTNFSPPQKVIDDMLNSGYNKAKEYCKDFNFL